MQEISQAFEAGSLEEYLAEEPKKKWECCTERIDWFCHDKCSENLLFVLANPKPSPADLQGHHVVCPSHWSCALFDRHTWLPLVILAVKQFLELDNFPVAPVWRPWQCASLDGRMYLAQGSKMDAKHVAEIAVAILKSCKYVIDERRIPRSPVLTRLKFTQVVKLIITVWHVSEEMNSTQRQFVKIN